jgi:hypothetical protein
MNSTIPDTSARKLTFRRIMTVIAITCLGYLLYVTIFHEQYFLKPTDILLHYDLPTLGLIIAALLATLPSSLKLSVIITLLMITAIEGTCYILNQQSEPEVTQTQEPAFKGPHRDLGYAALRGVSSRSIKKSGSKIIYDVTYTLDGYGRRTNPGIAPQVTDRYVLFFGGSFAFGEGLKDNQTLPASLAAILPDWKPYNYGYPGYGPQHVLTLLQKTDLAEQVAEKDGILIYPIISAHVQRAMGSMIVYTSWGYNMPNYTLNTSGTLVRNADFTRGRPLKAMLYSMLARSQLIKYLGLDIPIKESDEDMRLTAKIIATAKQAYTSHFGNDNFYVLIWPGASTAKTLIPYLEDEGIMSLDYFDAFDSSNENYRIAGDGHPSALATEALAQRLMADIKQLYPSGITDQ